MDKTKQYQIVAWQRERNSFGDVRNIYGEPLFDSSVGSSERDRPEALRILSKANTLCRQHGPVAIGRVDLGVFHPIIWLEVPVEPKPRHDPPVVPMRSLREFPLTAPAMPT